MHVPLNDLRRCNEPYVAELRAAFDQVVGAGSFILGRQVSAFEEEFAGFCGVAHCVGMANGSDALELALRAVGISADDEVITVANAGMYSTVAIRAIGAPGPTRSIAANGGSQARPATNASSHALATGG